MNSTMRSSSLRLARRAGEKTTISQPNESASAAQKIAMLRHAHRHVSIALGGVGALLAPEGLPKPTRRAAVGTHVRESCVGSGVG